MKTLLHLSDLHFRQNWEEDQGVVLKEFFNDIQKQLSNFNLADFFVVFSGDIVLAGGNNNFYNDFLKQFDSEFNKLGIPKSQRICIPGNHDVSMDFVKDNFFEHDAIVKKDFNEKDFNDYMSKSPAMFKDKFLNYKNFEPDFAEYGVCNSILLGNGFNIEPQIGIFCLNTAVFSSGGYNQLNDKGNLVVDTRVLNKWIIENKAKTKVLIMHHPIDWFVEWAQIELKKIIVNSFSLCLSGHIHEQDIYHSIQNNKHCIQCSAPPLLTNKKGRLGYSLITVSDKGILEIIYRQWTKNHSFVTGVDFSNTDDGKISFLDESNSYISINDIKKNLLNERLEGALKSFSSQPIVWVDPIVSKIDNISSNASKNIENAIDLNLFVKNPTSTIIKAPPQFGLTCLSFHLILKAWELYKKNWLYLDFSVLKSHTIDRFIRDELKNLQINSDNIACIILDSWTTYEKDSSKILKLLSENYKNIPLIVMRRIDDANFLIQPSSEDIGRSFDILHLLALPRTQVRAVVTAYNNFAQIGDEDLLLTKLINDMEVLNIHRTPLNCITLLKVAEKFFDESPVNRTKMLEMVLFILFDMQYIPSYKSKPDLKDCEYVLGRFSEKILKSQNIQFSRDEFLKELKSFCTEKLVELDVEIVFDVLFKNNIIIQQENGYRFKYTYWVFYFAAHRMHQEPMFAEYIFENKRYISYAEIIEFYTGIDRRRNDALSILNRDISEIFDIVSRKVGLEDMNPFKYMIWNPTTESLEKMQMEITENVLNSKLPDSVKDQYADKAYNQIRPYDQGIQALFESYSLTRLGHAIKASSRALRNSDYANPELKRQLLNSILKCWVEFTKVIVAISPILSVQGQAVYDDATFVLEDDFGKTPEEKLKGILEVIPYNVVKWYKKDLFSEKMGPLLFDQLSKEEDEIKRHELAILIINERPNNWKHSIQDYISVVNKNSFFLLDVIKSLSAEYKYSYASPSSLRDMEFLIKMSFAKHKFGDKNRD